jgi:hypothetical protein
MICRHESLRTRIVVTNRSPSQYVAPPREYHLDVVDLTHHSVAVAEHEAMSLVQTFLDRVIDPSVDCLFEATLWKLGESDYLLVLALDHIVADGISFGILNRETWELYNSGMEEISESLPPLRVQFPDYAIWQQRTYRAWMREYEAYWRQHLAGAESVQIPCDLCSNALGTPETLHVTFGTSLSLKLREMARHQGTVLSMVVLAIYVIVMSRWCRQEDELLLSYAFHGRSRHPELPGMIGPIVHALFLRITLIKGEPFRDLLVRTQMEVCSALGHLDFGVVPDLLPDCLTEVSFNWQPTTWAGGSLDHHFIAETLLTPVWAKRLAAKHERPDQRLIMSSFPARWSGGVKFNPIFYDTEHGIQLVVTYAPNVLARATMQVLCDDLKSVASQVAESPLARLSEIVTRTIGSCRSPTAAPSLL